MNLTKRNLDLIFNNQSLETMISLLKKQEGPEGPGTLT